MQNISIESYLTNLKNKRWTIVVLIIKIIVILTSYMVLILSLISLQQFYPWLLGYLFHSLNHKPSQLISSLGGVYVIQPVLPICSALMLSQSQEPCLYRHRCLFTHGYTEVRKCLPQGHKCHDWDLNQHPDVLTTRTRVWCTKRLGLRHAMFYYNQW